MFAMAYSRPDAPINVGQLFDRFLRRQALEKQEAAYQIGVRNEVISRAIQGTGPLDVWALSRWPTTVLAELFKTILQARIEAEFDALGESLNQKAE